MKRNSLLFLILCANLNRALTIGKFKHTNVTRFKEMKTIKTPFLLQCCASCDQDCGGVSYDNLAQECKMFQQIVLANDTGSSDPTLLIDEYSIPFFENKPNPDGLLLTGWGTIDKSITVTDLYDESNICQPLSTGSVPINGASIGLINSTYPIICGGYGGYGGNFVKSCSLFGLDYRSFSVPKVLTYSSSVQLNPEKLWIFGGYDSSASYFITIDGWENGPEIPIENRRTETCTVTINDQTAMVIGGNPEAGNKFTATFFVDLRTFTWTPGPRTKVGRFARAACGVFHNALYKLRKMVVVVGGGAINYAPTASTEFYDVEQNTWTSGPDFVGPITDGAIVASWNSKALFHIGGITTPYTKSIYKLTCTGAECKWTLYRADALKKERRLFVSAIIPRSLASCTKP